MFLFLYFHCFVDVESLIWWCISRKRKVQGNEVLNLSIVSELNLGSEKFGVAMARAVILSNNVFTCYSFSLRKFLHEDFIESTN